MFREAPLLLFSPFIQYYECKQIFFTLMGERVWLVYLNLELNPSFSQIEWHPGTSIFIHLIQWNLIKFEGEI